MLDSPHRAGGVPAAHARECRPATRVAEVAGRSEQCPGAEVHCMCVFCKDVICDRVWLFCIDFCCPRTVCARGGDDSVEYFIE